MSTTVERAVRRRVAPRQTLRTPAQNAPFVVERIDDEGVVLLLGAGRAWTRLSWACLEGVVPFLDGRGWVPIGARYDVEGNPDTLDGYLKGCVKRATASWVAALLERAGVAEVARTRPAQVRLATRA